MALTIQPSTHDAISLPCTHPHEPGSPITAPLLTAWVKIPRLESPLARSHSPNLVNIKHGLCLRKTCGNKSCFTGSVHWEGLIGTAIRSDSLHSLNLCHDKALIQILGCDVHWEPQPTERIVSGIRKEAARTLSIPGRAEVVKRRDERGGNIIGWVLFDTEKIPKTGVEVPILFLAVIRRWRRTSRTSSWLGSIEGLDYLGEECLDVLALKQCDERPGAHERVGVGKVVDKTWIESCERSIEVW